MSLRATVCSSALVLAGIAGCGGDNTRTVVQTVVVAPPSAQGTAPTETAPTGTVTTQTLPSESAPTEPPPENLPSGAIAVQGRFTMRIVKEDGALEINNEEQFNEGESRMWFTKTTCDTDCRVELRRELPSGAFETVTLDPVPGDRTRYATEARVKTNFCNVEENRYSAATRRISLKASATKDLGGKLVAIRLDGYIVVNQRCGGGSTRPPIEKGTTQYRGTAGMR